VSLGPAEVLSARVDVADAQAVAAHAATVAERFGVVHQVYNNAGIADSGPVEAFTLEQYRRVLDVNLWGVIHGTTAFLPHLIASGDGHVVNISSLNGIMAQAGLTAYCASKFAVRGFTESLALDLAEAGHPVHATVVHPGGVRTNIATAAMASAEASGREITDADRDRLRFYNDKLLRMDPARAAAIVLDAVEADRPRALVGNDARVADALVRLLPARWPRVIAPLARKVLPPATPPAGAPGRS